MRARRQDRFQAPARPSFDFPDLETLEIESFDGRKHFEAARFEHLDVSGVDLSGAVFTECDFTTFTADDTRLLGARFVDSRLSQVNAPRFNTPRVTLRNTQISSSRLGAMEAYDSELSQVQIEGSKLGWVNLRSSRLTDVSFIGCRFEELDLSDCTLLRVSFENCTTQSLALEQSRSQHLDLRGLNFTSIQGLGGLKGARVSEQQGLELLDVFAQHFGVEITN
ncbi:uncharacterized protein YjbI with pentapeptide repeats [Leucobacter luti]|nr:uncharacterized protein YjbI with pentapeptide repeats [Leucobacter luti]